MKADTSTLPKKPATVKHCTGSPGLRLQLAIAKLDAAAAVIEDVTRDSDPRLRPGLASATRGSRATANRLRAMVAREARRVAA